MAENPIDTAAAARAQHEERIRQRNERLAKERSASESYEFEVFAALDDAEMQYGTHLVARLDICPGKCSVIVALTDATRAPIRHLRTLQRSQGAAAPKKLAAAENVAKAALVWFKPFNTFQDLDTAYSAATETIVNRVLTLAGAQDEDDAGK